MSRYVSSKIRFIPSQDTAPLDLDFLEIGTSNFDTLLQTASNEIKGMSVEPIKYYLDELPDRQNIIKVNAAITSNRISDTTTIYHIPADVIEKNKLEPWLKGCNSINQYHPWHTKLGLIDLVQIDTVPLINIEELLKKYNIRYIKFLKIDTEGHDIIILNGLFDYLNNIPKKYYPHKIQFESNHDVSSADVDAIIRRANKFSYRLISRGFDTILEIV